MCLRKLKGLLLANKHQGGILLQCCNEYGVHTKVANIIGYIDHKLRQEVKHMQQMGKP